jgi:hypothetical protein
VSARCCRPNWRSNHIDSSGMVNDDDDEDAVEYEDEEDDEWETV